jgi:hypothetical protein
VLDAALVRELAQHAFESGTIDILETKSARNFARPDFPLRLADEVEKVVFAGQTSLGACRRHLAKVNDQHPAGFWADA